MQSLAECGKRARSFLNQYHRCGSNSYANQQADYEDEHGEPMSLLALWIKSHSGKDGSFLLGTDTEDFVDDVKAKVEQLRLMYPTKSQTELENEAFEKTIYSDEIPDRPVGSGQGVNKGDIYGVHGVLRKEGYGKFQRRVNLMDNVKEDVATLYKKNEVLEKENEKLKDQVQENNFLLKYLVGHFSQIVGKVSEGNTDPHMLRLAQEVLGMTHHQVGSGTMKGLKQKDNDKMS